MTKFYKYLNEKKSNNVISVDIQPMYENFINFNLGNFFEWLSKQKKVLYLYNGPETVGVDREEEIMDWMLDYDFPEEKFDDIYFYDKGYGFFRSWMDMEIDNDKLQKVIRYMVNNRIWDSRDIPREEAEKILDDDMSFYDSDMISIPDIPLNILKKFSKSYLVGGGRDECLEEIQILMNAFNIKYTTVRKYIYG